MSLLSFRKLFFFFFQFSILFSPLYLCLLLPFLSPFYFLIFFSQTTLKESYFITQEKHQKKKFYLMKISKMVIFFCKVFSTISLIFCFCFLSFPFLFIVCYYEVGVSLTFSTGETKSVLREAIISNTGSS